MNILYVVDQFPKLSESFVINEVHELSQRGHEISVFTVNQQTEDIAHDEVEDLDVQVYNAQNTPYQLISNLLSKQVLNTKVLSEVNFVDSPSYHAWCLSLGQQISEAVEITGGIDLIHTHFASESRLAVTYAAAYHDVPCTVTAHAHEIFSPRNATRLERICSRFDHIIVPSEYNKRYLTEVIGTQTGMTVVPATTSVDKFNPSEGCVSGRLFTVARLVEKKGHEYAIDAVAELVENGYDIEYHIAGTGPREDSLRKRARDHNVQDHVKFLGHVSDEKLQSELHEAEIFLLPCVIASDGDRDVAPVALKEAMATQTACVSTSISAIPELISDGHDGILVKPNDSTVLARAISSLLDNPTRRKQIAANGRETVENKFDISQTVDKLLDVFESCVRSNNNTTRSL